MTYRSLEPDLWRFLWTPKVPGAPYLVSLYEDKLPIQAAYKSAIANGGMDNRTRTFPGKLGEVLEIIIQNSGATNGGLDTHPFHAHGAHYYDIGSGNGTYNVTANEERLKELYKRALEFLRADEPERRLDIRLSYDRFRSLEEEARKLYGDEAIYPRVEYSSEDSTVTIVTAQSKLHSSAAHSLQQWIHFGGLTSLAANEKHELGQRIEATADAKYHSLTPALERSTKVPSSGWRSRI
ncbi:hypothetical protein V1506DRAFT_516105 [Lipomyces tetrasporus]